MIQAATNSMPAWIRDTANKVNPMLNGYPFAQYDTAPTNITAGYTYYDSALNSPRTWNGTIWLTAVPQVTTSLWTAATGTATRTTFATYVAPTLTGSYVQATMQAAVSHIQVLSERLKALIDDLKANGAI